MSQTMDATEILGWLREENPERLKELWQRADDTRYPGSRVPTVFSTV